MPEAEFSNRCLIVLLDEYYKLLLLREVSEYSEGIINFKEEEKEGIITSEKINLNYISKNMCEYRKSISRIERFIKAKDFFFQ